MSRYQLGGDIRCTRRCRNCGSRCRGAEMVYCRARLWSLTRMDSSHGGRGRCRHPRCSRARCGRRCGARCGACCRARRCRALWLSGLAGGLAGRTRRRDKQRV
eukprot:1176719-Prorocentrum_minimum.AAC.2